MGHSRFFVLILESPAFALDTRLQYSITFCSRATPNIGDYAAACDVEFYNNQNAEVRTVRYRNVKASDLEICREILHPGFRRSRRVEKSLEEIWRAMTSRREMPFTIFTIIEDLALPYPQSVQAFGLSVFVRREFADEFATGPRAYLSAVVYESLLDARSVLLSSEEIGRANSEDGLDVIVLHFAMREPDLESEAARAVLMACSQAFFHYHSGYQINSLLNEVYGPQHAAYMRNGGFRLHDDFASVWRGDNDALRPYLFRLTKDEIAPSAVNPLSFLFHPLRPRIGFSRSEQSVLELALLNESDAEIGVHLGVSLDYVKKTWRRAYERAASAHPSIAGGSGAGARQTRGMEKRRHLLEYVRIHPEELRPNLRTVSARGRHGNGQ